MTWKPVLLFLGGLLLGGSSGILATKQYYKRKCFEEVERRVAEMEESYGVRDLYLRSEETEGEGNEEVVERSQGTMSQTSRDSMKELHRKRKEADNVDYTKFYDDVDLKGDSSMYPSITEAEKIFGVVDDPPCSPDMTMGGDFDGDELETDPAEKESPAEEANREHTLHKDDPPELIPEEALGDVPGWVEEETLFYDVEHQVLTDDNNDNVYDPWLHVGDIINKLDFDDPEFTGVFYVWNHAFDVLYTIECI